VVGSHYRSRFFIRLFQEKYGRDGKENKERQEAPVEGFHLLFDPGDPSSEINNEGEFQHLGGLERDSAKLNPALSTGVLEANSRHQYQDIDNNSYEQKPESGFLPNLGIQT